MEILYEMHSTGILRVQEELSSLVRNKGDRRIDMEKLWMLHGRVVRPRISHLVRRPNRLRNYFQGFHKTNRKSY